MHASKREFLKWSSLALVVPATPRAFANKPVRLQADPFGLGVASGAPSPNSVLLWTRLLGPGVDEHSAIPVQYEVWAADQPQQVVAKSQAVALRELGYAVHAPVQGLQRGRWYEYRFMVDGATSPVGRTRTLPAACTLPQRLRLAYASCQRYEDGHFAAYRAMVADLPDAVVFVGDYIYEYRSRAADKAVRTHPLRHARTLQDFRDRYALYRSDPLLQQAHAACPWFVTWDDHEVENNYAGLLSTEGRQANLPAMRMAAYQAFYENMPIARDALVNGIQGLLANQPLRLHTHADFGQLARLTLLDNRQYRAAPLCGAQPSDKLQAVCLPDAGQVGYRTVLGAEQEQWLVQTLGGSAAVWNVLAQQTRLTPGNYHAGLSQRFGSDTWDGYPQARQRLVDTLVQSKARNPLVLGGDIHQNWVAHVHQDPYNANSPVVATEFCGTSITSRSNATPQSTARAMRNNPHCVYANAQHRGYGLLDLTPQRAQVTLRAVRDVANPDSEVFDLQRFEVKAGQPEVGVPDV